MCQVRVSVPFDDRSMVIGVGVLGSRVFVLCDDLSFWFRLLGS